MWSALTCVCVASSERSFSVHRLFLLITINRERERERESGRERAILLLQLDMQGGLIYSIAVAAIVMFYTAAAVVLLGLSSLFSRLHCSSGPYNRVILCTWEEGESIIRKPAWSNFCFGVGVLTLPFVGQGHKKNVCIV